MKYAATIARPDGKVITLASPNWIDITIKDGNKIIARLSVHDGAIYDHNNRDISTITPNPASLRGY